METAQLTTEGAKNFPLRVRGRARARLEPPLPAAASSLRRAQPLTRLPAPRTPLPRLQIDVTPGGIKQEESEFNALLMARLLPKLHWGALRSVAAALGIAELPEAPPAKPEEDAAFLKSLHDLVMDIHVVEGSLVCPNCGRVYPIANGVPNMLLTDDEV